MPLVLEAARAAKCEKVVFLEYTLTLRMQYPGQLVQAAYALKALMERGMKPEHIIVGGDSAGGNLVLALLAHLKKPLLEAPVVDGFGEGGKVRGVVLLSPWYASPRLLCTQAIFEDPADLTIKTGSATPLTP